MNIAICINTLSSGGGESFSSSLAKAYKRIGHNVIVVVYKIFEEKGLLIKSQLENYGIRVIDFNRKKKCEMFGYPIRLASVFREFKIDVVHSHLEQTDLMVALSRLLYNKPLYIRTLHSMNAMPEFPIFVHKFLFNQFKLNIGCGKIMKENYSIPTLKKNIIPIDNGIEFPTFSIDDEKEIRNRIRRNLKIGDNEFIFIQIGRFKPVLGSLCKGHDLTLAAVNSLKGLRFRVIFIGENSDMYNAELYNQEYLKDDRLLFLGSVPNPIDYIIASDAVLAPSRVEGLPISSLEGASCGKPLIASPIKVFDLFKNDSTLRMATFHPDSLALKMRQSIDNKEILLKAAINNTTYYKNKYSIDNTAVQYLSLIYKYVKPLS